MGQGLKQLTCGNKSLCLFIRARIEVLKYKMTNYLDSAFPLPLLLLSNLAYTKNILPERSQILSV